MAQGVYTSLARGDDGMEFQNSPAPQTAVARYNAGSGVSSVITVTDNTTTLEVGATGGAGVFLKWIGRTDTIGSVTGANFDNFIPSNTVRRFAIPIETRGTSSIVGANIQNGLYNRVAWFSAVGAAGASSVIASEYA